MHSRLTFQLTDYLELVDRIGGILRDHKRDAISEKTPETLQQ
jgi:hypothetical protein